MSELDTLPEQFDRLLEGIRGKFTLEEWRYAYRKVIYSGAMRILQDHPEIVVGPKPAPSPQPHEQMAPTRGGGAPGPHPGGNQPPPNFTAGQKPPYYPSAIGELACIALGNCHPPPGQD